ncbi:TKL protein kinase [Podila verticillata NRRL 6337]|nr:TKL protein kinase [Podila verticillata NRRL 6337]
MHDARHASGDSTGDVLSNATALNRRSSIRSASTRVNTPRRHSTLEIEIEYIRTTTTPIAKAITTNRPLSNVTQIPMERPMHSVVEEEEEGEEEEEEEEEEDEEDNEESEDALARSLGAMQPDANNDRLARHPRPQSQGYPQIGQLNPRRSPQPSWEQYLNRGGASRPAIHSVQSAITHSVDLTSSHVQHSTPDLSTTGSQSEDEDELEEIQSPVELIEVLELSGEEEEEEIPADPPEQNAGLELQDEPVIETKETLRRERTRILQRTIVSEARQIDFQDISNIQPLKKGGYGEIHTAEWSRLKVVLKRALPEHSEGVEQFEQELEILKRTHDFDYIVTFYGITQDPRTNANCMVMKHCTNGNLVSFLEKNHSNLTWSERYRLSIEVAKGLEFLHKSGFHHRDLHSGNILLDDKRTAMICDFGLSRSSNKTRTTDLAAAVGVASFLAPERFPLQRPVYTAACDVYSLGVVFFHISSGKVPFGKRLHDPMLLRELIDGTRETIVPGTPKDYAELIVECWDKVPSKRPSMDVVIAVLQTLMAKPTEPILHMHPGFFVPSETESAALPIPPELNSRMASLERASNTLNKLVFDIREAEMQEIVTYIEGTRAYFRNQRTIPEPLSPDNPPTTPIYLCPLVGDLPALSYYMTHARPGYNPINESSKQTGDTALHLACLFLESPMDTIKVLVELGADINLENLQGYTPVMILVSSNTQNCFEALKYFVMRGARIPAYIRNPITPLNSAQLYALNIVNESRGGGRDAPSHRQGSSSGRPLSGGAMSLSQGLGNYQSQTVFQARNSGTFRGDRLIAQGRPLIHVVAAMQEDYRILDCLCEAGLDPAVTFGGETALVAAAAHLRIKNVEWLLNHDLDISTEAGIQRAIQVVKVLHFPTMSQAQLAAVAGSARQGRRQSRLGPQDANAENIRDLGKYSWAGVTYGEADRMSRDLVGPILNLLTQWTGGRRIEARKEVAMKLNVMYGSSTDPFGHGPAAPISEASTDSVGSLDQEQGYSGQPPHPPSFYNLQNRQFHPLNYPPSGSRQHSQQHHQQQPQQPPYQQQQQQYQYAPHHLQESQRTIGRSTRSLRKSQRHVIGQVLTGRESRLF